MDHRVVEIDTHLVAVWRWVLLRSSVSAGFLGFNVATVIVERFCGDVGAGRPVFLVSGFFIIAVATAVCEPRIIGSQNQSNVVVPLCRPRICSDREYCLIFRQTSF